MINASAQGRRLVELSHTVRHGLLTYPGLPAPEIGEHLSRAESRHHYAPGTEFRIGRITLVGNTGTYLDAPSHRYPDGADLAGLPLDRLVELPGLCIQVPAGTRAIDLALLSPYQVAGQAVLLRTGWDAHFATARYGDPDHPYLTEEGARWLAKAGAILVGIDSVNIDDTAPGNDGRRPAHSTLLAAGIPIVEHLRGLEQLPSTGFQFTAVPPPVQGLDSFPVRAFAVIG